MAKTKLAFVCVDCGTEHGQWQGQCASCKAWNTLSQINLGSSNSPATKIDFRKQGYAGDQSNVQNLSDLDLEALPRFQVPLENWIVCSVVAWYRVRLCLLVAILEQVKALCCCR